MNQTEGGVEDLYPFLYEPVAGGDALREEVRRSTGEKLREIVALRECIRDVFFDRLATCALIMARRFAQGGKLLTMGNGGSATDAQGVAHLYLHPPYGRPLPAVALCSDVATVTALANDVAFDVVFARQVAALSSPSDIVLGLSTSGSSENVLRALEESARRGLLTVALAGYEGGKMADMPHLGHLFVIPSTSVHRIQEAQTTVYHILWELVQEAYPAGKERIDGNDIDATEP